MDRGYERSELISRVSVLEHLHGDSAPDLLLTHIEINMIRNLKNRTASVNHAVVVPSHISKRMEEATICPY